jgi:hypothetical protein
MKILLVILITPWIIGITLYLANRKKVDRIEKELIEEGKLPRKPNKSVVRKVAAGVPWMPYVNQMFHFNNEKVKNLVE